jgi:hypothetical protein
MADQAIDLDMSLHTHHTQARVPALPMPVHALAVDVPVGAIMAVVAVDVPVAVAADQAVVKVAGITVTEHPLSYGRAAPRVALSASRISRRLEHFHCRYDSPLYGLEVKML